MNEKENLILIGAGGHAKSCIDVLNSINKFNLKGIIGLEDELGSHLGKYEIIGVEQNLPKLVNEIKNAFIAIGQIKTAKKRISLFNDLLNIGYQMPSIISPRSYVSPDSKIGIGCIIMHGAIVNAGAEIGDNCIVNTNALIEHDSVIENHCHISTGSIINGSSRIGEGSFIGSGTVVNNNIKVGINSFISSCKNIYNDQPDFVKLIK